MSYPCIFSPDETASTLIINGVPRADDGLGKLSDATACICTQELNGEYELQFSYPTDGHLVNNIVDRAIIRAKPDQLTNEQFFRIYSIVRSTKNMLEVSAKHISYDLSGVVIKPFTVKTLDALVAKLNTSAQTIPNNHGFTFVADYSKTSNKDLNLTAPASVRSVIGGSSDSAIERFDSEIKWNNFVTTFFAEKTLGRRNTGIVIRYGKNIVDGTQENNIDAVFTYVLPYWKGSVTMGESSSEVWVYGDPVKTTTETPPYMKIEPLDVTSEFETQPTKAQVEAKASEIVARDKIGIPKISLNITYAQLKVSLINQIPQNGGQITIAGERLIDSLGLGDDVTVYIDRMATAVDARITSLEYNVLTGLYENIGIGDATQDLSNRLSTQSSIIQRTADGKTESLLAVMREIAERITGNRGGYVLLEDTNNDGFPDRLRILPQDSGGDPTTETNQWVWNYAGLAYIDNNGAAKTALTNDGQVVAERIRGGAFTGKTFTGGTFSGTSFEGGSVQSTNYVEGSDAHYSSSGMLIDLSNGSIRSVKFAIDANGNAYFNGTVYASKIEGWDAQGMSIGDLNHLLPHIYADEGVINSLRVPNGLDVSQGASDGAILITLTDETHTKSTFVRMTVTGLTYVPTGKSATWQELIDGTSRHAVFG